MHREVVSKLGDNMAVVDVSRDLWGKMKYTAGVLKIKMVPKTWCEAVGTFSTEEEARAAAVSALEATTLGMTPEEWRREKAMAEFMAQSS